MALFFFVSGFFYKHEYEDNVLEYINSRAKKLLIPYYLYNVFYGTLTFVIFLTLNITLGQLPNFKNFVIEPFLSGHQYYLYLAAWFVPQLFIVQIIFLLIYKYNRLLIKNDFYYLSIFFVLSSLGILWSMSGTYPVKTVIIRTAFGLFFYYLGLIYKNNSEKINIFNTYLFVAAIIASSALQVFAKYFGYILVRVQFNTSWFFLPIVSSIIGIYIFLFLSKAFSNLINENDILYKIGNNTFHIMANLFVFFCLNFIGVSLKGLDYSVLKDVWFSFTHEKYWFIYSTAAILLPTFIAEYCKKLFTKTKKERLLCTEHEVSL